MMKIFNASQIRQADAYTILNEPISSIDLMERAATKSVEWIAQHFTEKVSFMIFCGTGNNGGDGLAIARLLHDKGYPVNVCIVKERAEGLSSQKRYANVTSQDFIENEKRFSLIASASVTEISQPSEIPDFKDEIIIDALFGTGISRPVKGIYSRVIDAINRSGAEVISIDVPSGLFTDKHSENGSIVQAKYTLTFQLPKFAFLFPENEKYVGDFHLLDIGLDQNFIEKQSSNAEFISKNFIQLLLRTRKKFSHKGDYGHALIIAGGPGKMGAAILATKACLRAGAGLVSALVPEDAGDIMQVACPEAMLAAVNDLKGDKFNAIGIGPGIGTGKNVIGLLKKVLKSTVPLILDADALNILSADKSLLKKIPKNSILTPHPKEFLRLAGESENDFQRHERQIAFSKKYNVFVVLKGAHTCITTPEGNSFFNSTGNPGMAKGGSGDILTGIITSLLAQGYSHKDSALLGVYLHGQAGGIAAEKKGMDGMIAGDIIRAIPGAWKMIREGK